ncbi:MAG: YbaB/EbfC family nucleoid-associated protein [Armatimonadota bacterium]|nr:YbaB/EbfC family nucleoid-associated protein [Armatimonadota bacterium]MDR7451002.1 YbaB/EbfC family nucleoid-associated protein [Armatimonadota bacterium]MDR7465977.1 YbaB/EbfC family nucleoid-associated protein [Armatimonadota bacterium]MDR7494042.1 YbaB/EbfC family nucleoid-associated protein [Armatimonadota bacterium]MDR7498492.1 YbaB/EbfC family nucleoid-associated protein [Armatimonadota bacterium]
MRDLGKMMKQVQKLQAEMARVQEEMKGERVEATAGGGVVRAVANLHGEIQEIRIDPSVVDPSDVTMLQDLILAALTEVQRAARTRAEEKMRTVTGGLPLPPGLI